MKKDNLLHISFLLLFFCCLLSARLDAQSAAEGCINEVKSMYKKMLLFNPMLPKEEKTYYMNYSLRTVPKDSVRDPVSVSFTEIWASGLNLEINNEYMSVYQDADEAFIVLPQKKLIMRNDAYKPGSSKEKKMNRLNFIQDTLFSMSKTTRCMQLEDGSKFIELEVNEKGRQMLSVKRLTFIVDLKEQQFRKVKIEYTDGGGGLAGQVAYIEYEFKDVSFNYLTKRPSSNVSRIFMRSDSEFNDKYSSYELVDNRLSKNKKVLKQLK